jgi:hypothetical protein|tara:strand:- start:1177 stop:1347 length:171 start_codon:yes stop_codon:yes gene_type:complete
MSIAKDIVDTIEKGELVDAKELINQGIKEKAAQAVDFKRVALQVDWMANPEEHTGV